MPRTPMFLSREGRLLPGVKQIINVPAPAAGQEWKASPPGGKEWRVLGGQATLTASAAVANRFPGVEVTIGGILAFLNWSASSIAAAGVATPLYQKGEVLNMNGTQFGIFLVAMEYYWLRPGDFIQSRTVNIDVADQYSNISLIVEEVWIDEADLTDVLDIIAPLSQLLKQGG